MKSITEFPSFTLSKGLQTRATLSSEGKSPEEIQTSLGESFKFEGDKLKYFMNALDVADQNKENLKRVLVLTLNEGENAPPKAIKVEETHYLPEFLTTQKAAPASGKNEGRGGGRGKGRGGGGGRSGEKSSPWGLSPEQKAAKNQKPPAGNPG